MLPLTVGRLVDAVKATTSYFSHSSQSSQLLLEQQKVSIAAGTEKELKKPLGIITHCETRWNTVFYMMERLAKIYKYVNVVLDSMGRGDIMIPPGYVALMKEVVATLEPWKNLTKLFSEEQQPLISDVLPAIILLAEDYGWSLSDILSADPSSALYDRDASVTDLLEEIISLNTVFISVPVSEDGELVLPNTATDDRLLSAVPARESSKGKLVRRIDSTDGEIEEGRNELHIQLVASIRGRMMGFLKEHLPLLSLAQILDVRYRRGVLTEHQIEESFSAASALLELQPILERGSPPAAPMSQINDQDRRASLSRRLALLAGKVTTSPPLESCSSSVASSELRQEWELYLRSEAVDGTGPLLWCKSNQMLFPRLSAIARTVFAVHTASVPSERVWSDGSQILNKMRSSMSEAHFNHLLFLGDPVRRRLACWNAERECNEVRYH